MPDPIRPVRPAAVFALWVLCCLVHVSLAPALRAEAPASAPAAQAPPKYVPATAFHILPETHNNESGYFSLAEGLDGKVYVGTALYGENSFLVEFDPVTEKQRVVIDTNKVCGIDAAKNKGYAAQSKIHTRNFVAPSGVIYVGSMQGHPAPDETTQYPGGHVMSYDPRADRAENLGMPLKGAGVIDVVADEARGLLYVVTFGERGEHHWMLGDVKGVVQKGRRDPAKQVAYRDLGPRPPSFGATLLGPDGRAHVLTKEFELASYDPASDKVTVRPIEIGRKRWSPANDSAVPTWVLAPGGASAYAVLMNDPTLVEIALAAGDGPVAASSHGQMVEGANPDSRCALSVGPDGRLYAMVRTDNETGFGDSYLHHLVRFDPKTKAMEELGVPAVQNREYLKAVSTGPDGKPRPWTHGYHALPDGTVTPLHSHLGMIVAKDGTVYATILYPFTLLKMRVDDRKHASTAAPASAAN